MNQIYKIIYIKEETISTQENNCQKTLFIQIYKQKKKRNNANKKKIKQTITTQDIMEKNGASLRG